MARRRGRGGPASPDGSFQRLAGIIQGIVTGVGFLGAGVIMREGFTITGLTTAASIWTVSVIGIVVGLGFYATAILLTLLATAGMVVLRRFEKPLPSHSELAVRLRFARGTTVDTAEVCRSWPSPGISCLAHAEGREPRSAPPEAGKTEPCHPLAGKDASHRFRQLAAMVDSFSDKLDLTRTRLTRPPAGPSEN